MKQRILFSVIGLIAIFSIFAFWKGGDLTSGTNSSNDDAQVTMRDINPGWPMSVKAAVPVDHYGIPANKWIVKNRQISRNESLADILKEYGSSAADIYHLVLNSRNVFDVRSIRPGHNYRLYIDKDSVAHYMIYEVDPTNYVVFKTGSHPKVYTGTKAVVSYPRIASGTITSSLYETLYKQHLDASLADKLADVFAWQIDFYHLQKGDNFKIIFDEQRVEGKPVGAGPIIAARFEHNGEAFYAYRFTQNGRVDYFDESGNSLRKAFLKAPLKYTRISSRYSLHRFHPIEHRWEPHLGVDFAAPVGTPIHATGDGVIAVAGYGKYNGNWVKIRHNSVYQTGYLHMSRIAKGIHKGVHVKQGQLIGYVGSTGLATGPHVCYRFWKDGKQVNALKVHIPSSNPIKPQNLDDFDQHIARWVSQLNISDKKLAGNIAENRPTTSSVMHIDDNFKQN
ncbi:MAG TPA: peptidoglycan DD-metalloendopeptidase family protein [Balneolales bacterium]|nr:peptidoglycan DD-metalloendopeptidase family protein [Balneolales bacterium]